MPNFDVAVILAGYDHDEPRPVGHKGKWKVKIRGIADPATGREDIFAIGDDPKDAARKVREIAREISRKLASEHSAKVND